MHRISDAFGELILVSRCQNVLDAVTEMIVPDAVSLPRTDVVNIRNVAAHFDDFHCGDLLMIQMPNMRPDELPRFRAMMPVKGIDASGFHQSMKVSKGTDLKTDEISVLKMLADESSF